MAADEVTALRLRLLELGYSPIPLFGKEPPIYGKNNQRKGLGNWQQLDGVTGKQIEMWAKTWPDATNTGALTRLMPTLDLDILSEEAARAIEDYVRERYEERGHVLTRIGRLPKRAIPFRTQEPFSKIVANVVAPNGSAEKLEFLADGQQVVVAGIHPETKQPYRWHGGEPGQIAREDLPYIREEEAHELVAAAVEILVRDYGYTRAPERPRKQRKRNGGDSDTAAGAADWQYLFDNIRAGCGLHDSLRDLAAKLIASGTSAGAAVNQLRALMEDAMGRRRGYRTPSSLM
jgi:Bifunctional DNA primase/polymerase, N-terminal